MLRLGEEKEDAARPALDPDLPERRAVSGEDFEGERRRGVRVEAELPRFVRDRGRASAGESNRRAADRLADGVHETPLGRGRREQEGENGDHDDQ